MKTFIPYSLLAAAAACGLAFGQTATTTPVGYVTQTLAPNSANLIGLTLHAPSVAAGVITAESSTSVSVSTINFTTLLTAGKTYILELEGGIIQEIKAWSGSDLTTADDITAFVTPGTTKFVLRPAVTISDIFGANNSAGLKSTATGDPGTYDEVLVLNAAGNAFISCFYYDDGTFKAWYDSNFNDVANLPLVYADSMYVRRIAGSPINLVVTGEVKTTPTTLALISGNTFAGTVNPVGTTLGNSGLSAFLKPDNGVDPNFDKVLIQQPNGSYITYNYYNDGSFASWYDSNFVEATNVPLAPGVVIQTSTPKNVTINAPVIAP